MHHSHLPLGVRDRAQLAFQSDPIPRGFHDDESLVPIMSFDYFQFSVSEDNKELFSSIRFHGFLLLGLQTVDVWYRNKFVLVQIHLDRANPL